MNIEHMVSEFLSSPQGQQAKSALMAQGIPEHHAHKMLHHAAHAAGQHMEHHHGLLGDHPGRSFFAAFAAGLIRGDGVTGALGDGAEGVIAARVTEAIMDKMGVESGLAETAAAAAAPYLVHFLKQQFM
jgi:hypothetical protein